MNEPEKLQTRCLIVGGGPAGMMAGYLMARAGVQVAVLEKHADFIRDFRGDTIHPSTLELMHELGLLEEFLKQPHQEVRELRGVVNGQVVDSINTALRAELQRFERAVSSRTNRPGNGAVRRRDASRQPRRQTQAARRSNRTHAPPSDGSDDPPGEAAPLVVERPRRRGDLTPAGELLVDTLDRLDRLSALHDELVADVAWHLSREGRRP